MRASVVLALISTVMLAAVLLRPASEPPDRAAEISAQVAAAFGAVAGDTRRSLTPHDPEQRDDAAASDALGAAVTEHRRPRDSAAVSRLLHRMPAIANQESEPAPPPNSDETVHGVAKGMSDAFAAALQASERGDRR